MIVPLKRLLDAGIFVMTMKPWSQGKRLNLKTAR